MLRLRLTPTTRPTVKAAQNIEFASAASLSTSPISFEQKVKSQLPTAVSAEVDRKTSVTTAIVVMTWYVCMHAPRSGGSRAWAY